MSFSRAKDEKAVFISTAYFENIAKWWHILAKSAPIDCHMKIKAPRKEALLKSKDKLAIL